MGRTIEVFFPGKEFPSVSVTGSDCSRACEHCGGRYLHGMADVSGRGALLSFGMSLWKGGGVGMLISGGCRDDGTVPISDDILSQVSSLKDETDLMINMHTGLVTRREAERISSSGVDVVSFDLVGSDRTIKDVLHLDRTFLDFKRSYGYLIEAGIEVVPHILAGIHFGMEDGERNAIRTASEFSPRKAVLITLIPTKGTAMANVEPMNDGTLLSIATYMRFELDSKLYLGCMRPKGRSNLEISMLDLGFDGIVLPLRRTLAHIEEKGWRVEKGLSCCAI